MSRSATKNSKLLFSFGKKEANSFGTGRLKGLAKEAENSNISSIELEMSVVIYYWNSL